MNENPRIVTIPICVQQVESESNEIEHVLFHTTNCVCSTNQTRASPNKTRVIPPSPWSRRLWRAEIWRRRSYASIYHETELCITYYLGQDVLWNVRYKEYSKRDQRHAAIQMIQQQMQHNGREMTGGWGYLFTFVFSWYWNAPECVYMHYMSRAYSPVFSTAGNVTQRRGRVTACGSAVVERLDFAANMVPSSYPKRPRTLTIIVKG